MKLFSDDDDIDFCIELSGNWIISCDHLAKAEGDEATISIIVDGDTAIAMNLINAQVLAMELLSKLIGVRRFQADAQQSALDFSQSWDGYAYQILSCAAGANGCEVEEGEE